MGILALFALFLGLLGFIILIPLILFFQLLFNPALAIILFCLILITILLAYHILRKGRKR
jgi:hypothetical protein